MRTWLQFLQDTFQTGSLAVVATPIVTALCGKAEGKTATAPVNAISHILWGDEAARHDESSLKYTASGVVLNTAAMAPWAALYEALPDSLVDRRHMAGSLAGGAAVAAAAYVTDYHVVPRRLTPGFEKRLSGLSLLAIYSTLAVSLALAGRQTYANRYGH